MPATQAPPQQHTVPDMTWEKLWSGSVHTLMNGARPWACLAAEIAAGWAAHRVWGHMPALPWASVALTLATTGLAAWAWLVSRLPSVGRAHTVVTVAAAGAWLTVATITGPFERVTGGALAIGGATLALSWMLRGHARRHHHGQAAASAAPRGADRLKAWFAESAGEAGMKGAELHGVTVDKARATARAELPAGKTAADLISAIPRIESAAGLPPGTITASVDSDRADHAGIVLSDPRVLSMPIPWPGPSAPGASIAEPLRPGVWQDSQPVAYVIVGHHVFMMGASGSGKSMGGAWNLLGEAMTRPDSAILAADITKGAQTFGPLLPGVHRFERDKGGARALVNDVHDIIQPRTDHLAERGLQKWQPGCGLSYLLFWLEETADIWDTLGSKAEDKLINTARAIRSAGGTLVFSIQRNTFDQVPTIIRAQMASMCFGLNDPQDCRYGLSEAQQAAGVNPAEWGIRSPGKAVLDAPTIPVDRITMPLRTYSWGEGERASSAMLAHATAYPAATRPVDPITARICGSTAPARPAAAPARPSVTITAPASGHQDQDHEDTTMHDDDDDREEMIGNPVADYLSEDTDPSPDITAQAIADGPDAPIAGEPDDMPFEFVGPAEKMTPEAARASLAELLTGWRASGMESFAPRDMRAWLATTGMGRAWLQARLREAVEAGTLEYDPDSPGRYAFADGPADGDQ